MNNSRTEKMCLDSAQVIIVGAQEKNQKWIEEREHEATTLNVSLLGCLLTLQSSIHESRIWIKFAERLDLIVECDVMREIQSRLGNSFSYELRFRRTMTREKYKNRVDLCQLEQFAY